MCFEESGMVGYVSECRCCYRLANYARLLEEITAELRPRPEW